MHEFTWQPSSETVKGKRVRGLSGFNLPSHCLNPQTTLKNGAVPKTYGVVSHFFRLHCYWVGSFDFHFLVEIKLGFPLNPQKVIHLLQGQREVVLRGAFDKKTYGVRPEEAKDTLATVDIASSLFIATRLKHPQLSSRTWSLKRVP